MHSIVPVLFEAPSAAPPFDVVAIGSSAGGVEALHTVVSALPSNLPVAVVIVQHLHPRYDSLLPKLLARKARLLVHHSRPSIVRLVRPETTVATSGG